MLILLFLVIDLESVRKIEFLAKRIMNYKSKDSVIKTLNTMFLMCSKDFFIAIKESEYVYTLQYDEEDLQLIGESALKLAQSLADEWFGAKQVIKTNKELRDKILKDPWILDPQQVCLRVFEEANEESRLDTNHVTKTEMVRQEKRME